MPGAHALHHEVEPGISSVPFFAHADRVGNAVGLRVGAMGAAVGACVGADDGLGVGLEVGLHVSPMPVGLRVAPHGIAAPPRVHDHASVKAPDSLHA